MRAELLALLLACGPAASQPPPPETAMTCTVTVQPGEPVQPHLADGATVWLAAGVHRVNLDVAHSVTLKGDGAVLDGGGRGPVVRVGEHGKQVRLEGLTIRGGAHEFGSGVLVEGYSEVVLAGCTIDGNQRGPGKGAGLGARRGTLRIEGGAFGPRDDLVFGTVVEATLVGVDVAGDVLVQDGAQVRLEGGRVGGTLALRGTSTRQPTVTRAGAEVGAVDNGGAYPGTVRGE